MNIRALIAGISTVAVVTGGGLALGGAAASAQSRAHAPKTAKTGKTAKARRVVRTPTHTLTLTAAAARTVGYGQAYTTEASADYDTKGRLVGFDVLHFTENPSKRLVTVDGAFDLEDGIIYTTFTTATSSPTAIGEVIGGSGAYARATGTITATTKSRSKTAVRIVYTAK